MLRRVLTLVAECEHCPRVSDPFQVISKGHPKDNEPEAHRFMADIPFGWGTCTSGGWGATNYTRSQLLCPNCLDEAEEKKYGEIRRSEKQILDGLAEL